MNAVEITEAIAAVGVEERPFFYDSTYGRPKKDWLHSTFYPWFKNWLLDLGIYKWERRHDCDDFARSFCCLAQAAHALTQGNDDEAVAVGEFCYVANGIGPHAIVCAVVEGNEVVFLEPQSGQFLTLTEDERKSCFRVSF